MEKFVVSARKYRPSTFDTVVGQSSITTTLKNAIQNNHLAQAFLFCGPRGVGKTSCARILAKTINCMNLTNSVEACNECESCKGFNNNHSFNIHELDAASNNGVDKIRELVDQVRFAPQVGQFNIYIIDEVHMLSQAAFNAFLKTLEEPPAHAIFILATTEKHKIIPTILSRCQIFDFKRIQISDITQHLSHIAKHEGIQAEEQALHTIAQKADGALRDALSIFDQIISFCGNTLTYKDVIENLNILDYDYYFKLTDSLKEQNIPTALTIFNEILNNGFDGHHFINGMAMHFRNLLVSKDPITTQLLEVSDSVKKQFISQSQAWDQGSLVKALELCNTADINYKQSKNQRLLIELSLMRLCSIDISNDSAEKKTFNVKKTELNEKKTKNKTETNQGFKEKTEQTKPDLDRKSIIESDNKKAIKIVDFNEGVQKKTISINLNSPDQKKESEDRKEEIIVKRKESFDQEKLNELIIELSQIKSKEGKHNLSSILVEKKILLSDSNNLTITLDNKVQEEVLMNEKTEIISFLRDKLNNDMISLQTEIKELEQHEVKAYTDEDKFKKMAEKQPVLLQMKDEFNLEIDY
ncbi:MAG: DNA polymerase III subunit gamma/tau [Flavobacteriales bacterium]